MIIECYRCHHEQILDPADQTPSCDECGSVEFVHHYDNSLGRGLVEGNPLDGVPICVATNRKAYASTMHANGQLQEFRKMGREEREVYGPCKHCGRWHITSMSTGDKNLRKGEAR